MYIRWVIRKHKNAATAAVVFHDAYLVESFRDDHDNPRQRMICYLGNIRQINGMFPTIERELFLLRAERILATTSAVPWDERSAAMQLLERKVPPLSEAEVVEAFRNNLRWYHHWHRQRGCAPAPEDLLKLIEETAETLGPL